MPTTLATLDDAIIERLFQPAADLVRDRIGVHRETAACFCIDSAALAWIVSRTPGFSEFVTAWNASAAVANLLILLLGLVALVGLRAVFRRATAGRGNPLRPAMRPHRAGVLLMLAADLLPLHVPGLANTADIAMLVFAASALYLAACSEQSPLRRGWPALVRISAR
ncbi:hypothetical protein [Rhodopila sp.]|uniref:hypothetical protein n=1 Tax=Rhodopila sp. TaxID=2480087 RepID=UPI003D0E609E